MAEENRFSFLSSLCLALIVGVVPVYSLYLDIAAVPISGNIDLKRESIDFRQDDWTRSLLVRAHYQPAGERTPSFAEAQVDAATFDRLRIGDPLIVRYLPSPKLRRIPLLKTARFAGQSTFSILPDHYPAVAILSGITALVLLWRKAHFNFAGWLLIPYLAFVFCHLMMPAAEPSPTGPRRTAFATVTQVKKITEILETSDSPGVDAIQPYEIVALQFIPEGRTDSVQAVDKIDAGILPGLATGAAVQIEYQANKPRIVQIAGARRTFPQKAYLAVAQEGGEYIAGIAVLIGLVIFFTSAGKRFLLGLRATLEEAVQRRYMRK